jgi:hypothetical protein
MMSDHGYAFVLEGGAAASFTVTVESDGGVRVEIDHPWDGDTERGFGTTAYWTLDRAEVRQLRDFLNAQLEEQTGDKT